MKIILKQKLFYKFLSPTHFQKWKGKKNKKKHQYSDDSLLKCLFGKVDWAENILGNQY